MNANYDNSNYLSLEEKIKNWEIELNEVFHEGYGGTWSQAEEDFEKVIDDLIRVGISTIVYQAEMTGATKTALANQMNVKDVEVIMKIPKEEK